MANKYAGTQTEKNLEAAFAGESQARNKYTYFASKAKSEVKVWECRNCGHIIVGEKAPQVCPTCLHPQAYFEVNAENY